MKTPKLYTLGFFFSTDKKWVNLISKTKPFWQKDKLNGIGGKVEEGETPHQTMIREFEEETGHRHEDWRYFALMKNEEFEVYCYVGFGDVNLPKTMTEEKVMIADAEGIQIYNTLHNLNWLVPMALDDEIEPVVINYKNQNKYHEPHNHLQNGSHQTK